MKSDLILFAMENYSEMISARFTGNCIADLIPARRKGKCFTNPVPAFIPFYFLKTRAMPTVYVAGISVPWRKESVK